MEKWKDVVGYEGLYEISDKGRVKSTRRQGAPGGIKKLTKNQDGYLRVRLNKDGYGKKAMVHRLVYESFVGKIADGLEINHIDEVKTNNAVENLEAVSHIANIRHGTGIERNKRAHWKRVRQYTKDGIFIAEYDSLKAAAGAVGAKPCNISMASSGHYETAGGYVWRKA